MSALDRWASAPCAPRASAAVDPVPAPCLPPPLTDAQWCREKRTFALSVAHRLRQEVVEAGDPADQALEKVLSLMRALDDHPRHARNWWARHSADLRRMLAPFWPEQLGDEPLEGLALLEEVHRVFGRPRTGDLSVRGTTKADAGRAGAREGTPETQRGLGL